MIKTYKINELITSIQKKVITAYRVEGKRVLGNLPTIKDTLELIKVYEFDYTTLHKCFYYDYNVEVYYESNCYVISYEVILE